MSDESKLYSASDLAKRAGVSPSYVARLCRTGKLPATRLGGTWIIRAEDAERWLAERTEHQAKD